MKGLGGTNMAHNEIRKELLLAYLGAESLGAVNNLIISRQLDCCDDSDVAGSMKVLYKAEKTIFTSRIKFEQK